MDTHWFWGEGGVRFLVRLAFALGVGAVVAIVVCFSVQAVNSERIEACKELQGRGTSMGYNCELPTGEIVNPLKWSEKGRE